MMKLYFGGCVLLTTALVIGILLSGQTTEAESENFAQNGDVAFEDGRGDAEALSRIAALETQLAAVSARLRSLEARESDTPTEAIADLVMETNESVSTMAGDGPLPVYDGLIAAGLDSFTADEIARRVSESELQRLELRDKAIREGYIGSEQWREEMIAARQDRVRIRDELDSSTYDRYLYMSGQSNRVAVSSVMLGSAAERSGIEAGDVLLRYEDEALYKTGDIRGLTSQGERDELVDVTLLRNGNQLTVSMPRGPMGVRLSAIRINPDDS